MEIRWALARAGGPSVTSSNRRTFTKFVRTFPMETSRWALLSIVRVNQSGPRHWSHRFAETQSAAKKRANAPEAIPNFLPIVPGLQPAAREGSVRLTPNRFLVRRGTKDQLHGFRVEVDVDFAARREPLSEDLLRHGVFEVPLNGAQKRPRAIIRVEALFHQEFGGLLGQNRHDFLVFQLFADAVQNDGQDLFG